MLLAITKFELIDIRKALLAATSRLEGHQEKVSTGLRVISAILDKNIEVVPTETTVDEGDKLLSAVEEWEQILFTVGEYSSVNDFIEEQD